VCIARAALPAHAANAARAAIATIWRLGQIPEWWKNMDVV